MIKLENDCCDCEEQYRFCGDCSRRNAPHYYCDSCGDETDIYYFDDRELCINCVRHELEPVVC